VLWLDVEGVGDATVFAELGRRFGLHPLALEDAVNLHQRPKVEDYGDHVYMVARMPSGGGHMDLEQVSVFFGVGFVITVQEHPGDCFEHVRQRIRSARGRIRNAGADYLAYAVLDAIIDGYYPVIEGLNTRLEMLEERVLISVDEDIVPQIIDARHELHTLRQALSISREAVGQLARGDSALVTDETRLFLRDCQDHTAQLLDAIESCRELSAALVDLHGSRLNSRMNEIMKVLTMIATIFIPLGFIAGIYGMNFDPSASPWNMPELGWYLGYPFALALMLVTVLALLVLFRRKGLLGGGARVPRQRRRGRDPRGGTR